MTVMVQTAEGGQSYDQMIGEGNAQGNRIVQNVVDQLKEQTKAIQDVIAVLGLNPIAFEDSDSLSSPESVFQ